MKKKVLIVLIIAFVYLIKSFFLVLLCIISWNYISDFQFLVLFSNILLFFRFAFVSRCPYFFYISIKVLKKKILIFKREFALFRLLVILAFFSFLLFLNMLRSRRLFLYWIDFYFFCFLNIFCQICSIFQVFFVVLNSKN